MRPIYSKLFWVWCAVWTAAYFLFSSAPTAVAYISGIVVVPVFFVFVMDVPMVWMTAVLVGGSMALFGNGVYQIIGGTLFAVGAFSGLVEYHQEKKAIK